MLDFIMSPSFNQSFTSHLTWLGPWLFMLLSLIKIALIALGSLLISGLALFLFIMAGTSIRWIQNHLIVTNVMPPVSETVRHRPPSPPSITIKTSSPNDIPHLAA